MSDSFDVVIIGGGPGGYNCAIRCAQLGLKTACIEKETTFGGTCLNVGCIPSKALLHASELYETAEKDFDKYGIKVSALKYDLSRMMKQKEDAVSGLTQGIAFLFKKNGIASYQGAGQIVDAHTVRVKGRDDSQSGKGKTGKEVIEKETLLTTKHIVIATGSEPASLPKITFDETRIVSSTGALSLKKPPGTLVVIGAGVIGLELGSVWRRLGSRVEMVEYLEGILPGMDLELAKKAQRIFRKQGMNFHLGQKVTEIKKLATKIKVTMEAAKGGTQKILEADCVLVAIGRKPHTEGLMAGDIGLQLDEGGFVLTEDLQTSVPGVWAIGDCVTGPMLAHKAEEEGVACAERIAGKVGHVNYSIIPGVVYTSPEIASVGATEEALKAQGRAYKKGEFPFMANSRARTNHETDGFVKVLADANTDEILGVHILSKGAGEMIAEAVLAMSFQASSEDISRTVHAHPTLSEALRQAAMGVEGWTMQS